MPEPRDDEEEKDFISRCIPVVLEDGTAKDDEQAYAICKSKWDNKNNKSLTLKEDEEIEINVDPNARMPYGIKINGLRYTRDLWPDFEMLKVGARHSQRDQRALQDIHDAAITLGAACPEPPKEVTSYALDGMFVTEKMLVNYGGEVKALGGGRIGGYLITFSDEKSPDLVDDFFAPDTDFDIDFPGHSTVYFNHGIDGKMGLRKLSRADLKMDDFGIWAETILQERDEYEKYLLKLAKQGKLAWSSGTAQHLVEREPVGNAHKITKWPLGLDATLTHTPAEPRNRVIPLKTFLSELQPESIEPETEAEVEQHSTPEVTAEIDRERKLVITIKE